MEDKPEQPLSRLERRRARIRAEVRRNRTGGHKIPTWVLALVLALVLAGWVGLILVAG